MQAFARPHGLTSPSGAAYMAKAKRKHTAAAQRSKRRSPQQREELGTPGDFASLGERREWKQRLFDLIDTHYSKTPLNERQWWKVRDIADEHARSPGKPEIDDDKRSRMVDFLCRAIYRGELKDRDGWMQVANLDPSPLSPFRLDVTWLDFDQVLRSAFDGHLFVRRNECIECFARNNVDVPTAWLPSSELIGPDAPNKLTPTTGPEECWKVIDQPPHGQLKRRHAWTVLRQIWPEPGGPPRSMTIPEIAERMSLKDPKHSGGFAASTVKRLLKP